MRKLFFIASVLFCACSLAAGNGNAKVDWQVAGKIDLQGDFIDFAVTPDGQKTFFLTAAGDVLIYSDGKLEDKLQTGGKFDGVECSPNGERIYLSNRDTGSLQTIDLEYIKIINISGSPSRGPSEAPVKIVVFTDYQ